MKGVQEHRRRRRSSHFGTAPIRRGGGGGRGTAVADGPDVLPSLQMGDTLCSSYIYIEDLQKIKYKI